MERLHLARSFGGDVKSCGPTGATLCHAWSAGATHDKSSKDFKLCRLVVLGNMVLMCIGDDRDVLSYLRAGRRCRWAPWWLDDSWTEQG